LKPFAAAIFSLTTLSLTLTGNASQAENAVSDGDFAVTAPAETSRTDDSLRLMAQEVAQDDAAATNGPVYREMIYGDPAAPVTIVEYASLTCSHCATFHNTVLPEIKKNYLETGKVRLVFRDFPLDGLAMAGAMLARCASGDRGKAMLNLMFRQQAAWVMSEEPIKPLTSYAKLAGMNENDVNGCLENEGIMTAIRTVQDTASNLYKIASTPTFFINDVKVEGNRGYEFMAQIIDKKLEENGS